MNNISLTGNLATDLVLRTLPGEKGTSVIETRLAVRKRTRKDDQPDAIFVDLKVYGKTAELLAQYTTKGSRIGVTGRIDVDQWIDKETDKGRSRTYVVADEIEFLDSRKTSAEQPAAEPEPAVA